MLLHHMFNWSNEVYSNKPQADNPVGLRLWLKKKFSEVLEAFGPEQSRTCTPVFFLCLWRGISAQWQINRPETPEIT